MNDTKLGSVATVTFSSDAAHSLAARLLQDMVGWTIALTFEDGIIEHAKVLGAGASASEDAPPWGCLAVQNWNEETDTSMGEPYIVDLYGEHPGIRAVRTLHIF